MKTVAHAELDDWLRGGRAAPMPDALSRHLEACSACRAALEERDEVRSWFPDETPDMSQDAAAAIRFRLQAEARTHGAERITRGAPASGDARVEARLRRRTIAIAIAIAVAAVALIAIGGVARVIGWPRDGGPVTRATTTTAPRTSTARATVARATVEPSRDAVLRAIDDETYALSEGSAWFDVPPRAAGHHFRVNIGVERVEVHGTRFRVVASGNVLRSVEVDHGVVSVHPSSGAEHRLIAGMRWDRAEPQTAAAPATPAVTATATGTATAIPTAVGGPASSRVNAARASRDAGENVEASTSRGATEEPGIDRAFADAWQLRRAGRWDEASRAFDALLARRGLGARRADVLYWSARAHEAAGRSAIARQRFQKLVESHPRAWHAADGRRRLESLGGAR